MGVPADLLGKQVRCPHCKQVVLAPLNVAPSGVIPAVNLPPPPLSMVGPNAQTQAISQIGPAAPPPEPPLPTFNVQNREGAESILSGPGESEDEVFSQPGGRLSGVPPLDLTNPNGPSLPPTRPTLSDDNPFEIAGNTAATPGFGAPAPRPNPPAQTAELPNPFLELEPVTLPPAFQPAAPSRPAAAPPPYQPAPAPQPYQAPAPPRPLFPSPAPFPAAPQPAPLPPTAAANPFAGIDDPTIRPLPGPAPAPVPLPAADQPTESNEDAPRRRRKSRREEEDAPVAKAEEKPKPARTRAAAAPAAGGTTNVLLFVAIGYAVLITGLAAWALFIRTPPPPPGHPLEAIPDNFGEFNPAQRKAAVVPYRFNVDGDLPPNQRAALGGTASVGKLEVKPTKIERRKLRIETEFNGKAKSELWTPREALVLTLEIKNTSDLTFHPIDPAFTRRANEGKRDFPITRVVVDKKQFFAGGYLDWPPDYNKFKRKFETQQINDNVPLGPGQSREYVVFTDPDNTKVIGAVRGAKEVQWRVEVRRAPYDLYGREIPVTAIVGVDFRGTDVPDNPNPPA
jgi:hypothetical protein